MRKLSISLMGIAVIVLVAYVVFLQECSRPDKLPPGKIVVDQSFLDSLSVIANRPPDTVRIDTFITRWKTEFRDRKIPKLIPIDSETNYYSDSTINDTLSFWVNATVKGLLIEWNWRHEISLIEVEKIVEVARPFPVPYEVPVRHTGLYMAMRVGGGTHSGKFLFGADLDLINKKDNTYGIQYTRFGEENLIAFKVGRKIKLKR